MATAIILIVVLLTMAYFHLKCSVMSAFSTLMSGVIASVLALNYFEILADLLSQTATQSSGRTVAVLSCYLY